MNDSKRLKGKKIAIFTERQFEDIELLYPKTRLAEEGATITLIGTGQPKYEGNKGACVEEDITAKDASPEDFDALVIPGGYSPDYMRRDKAMVSFLKKMNEANKPIAAICHGPWMLAEAEVIRNKTVTSFPSIRTDLRHAGAEVVDKEVAVDGNLITSRNPDDLGAFCRAIIDALT